MRQLGLPLLAAICLAGSGSSSSAEGLPAYCYLRGDIGGSWISDSSAKGWARGASKGNVGDTSFELNSPIAEGGLGCSAKFSLSPSSLQIRGDVTFGNVQQTFHGSPPVLPGFTPATVSAAVNSRMLMFNGYIDFPTPWRMTPYVGLGLGIAWNEIKDVIFIDSTETRTPGRESTTMAGAVLAGVAFNIGDGWALDVGYRFLSNGLIGSNDHAGYGLKINDLSSHELRAGLRIPINPF